MIQLNTEEFEKQKVWDIVANNVYFINVLDNVEYNVSYGVWINVANNARNNVEKNVWINIYKHLTTHTKLK